ncbi:tyrosine-type recombinase/integrase [Aminobacter niigataensis]|uniref:tyrosine-type recombinase/integrase n=1 Tax=Aminobacter niigataensis TaxID=83265 RepID=UPI0022847FCC|nr:site-specific integrase [Aminobacter niigataensis]
MARLRLRDESYRQHRIGLTEDNCDADGMSFEQACAQAEAWYRSTPFAPHASDARPLGSVEHLLACPIGDTYTIGHALAELVEWKRLVAARSHFLTVVVLTNFHIVPRLFELPAGQMNSEHLRWFVKDVLETPPKRGNRSIEPRRSVESMTDEELRKRKKTINTLIGLLRMALTMAWENGRIDSDRPWRCLRRLPNVDRPRVLHLSRAECFRLLEACSSDLRRLVLGALYTGCRATELMRMQASHVGRDGPGVYVTPVKSYRPRVVLLPDEGFAFFSSLAKGKKPSEPLFVRDDGRYWFTNYRHAFKRSVVDAGLPDGFCFHGLRHTYASQLVQSGAPLIVVAEQLGHRNIDTVSRTYSHLAPDARLAEVRKRFASLIVGRGSSTAMDDYSG